MLALEFSSRRSPVGLWRPWRTVPGDPGFPRHRDAGDRRAAPPWPPLCPVPSPGATHHHRCPPGVLLRPPSDALPYSPWPRRVKPMPPGCPSRTPPSRWSRASRCSTTSSSGNAR
ncbi:hypothetical protein QJS66_19585 [Kocuria rhizophila]|nr:hypothetical protein QJS66_19585 [Kocuria rhizophila]